jgi:tRNA A58 N-methylase Trm61
MTIHPLLPRAIAPLVLALLIAATASAQRSGSTISSEQIFEAIGLREGMTVCEIGAGDGELSIAAARIVGPGGRVFTSELGTARVKTLQEKVTSSGLGQITVVTGDGASTNFPDMACDALFMRNVYHHFEDPDEMNASISAALEQGGRVAVVDFAPTGNEAEQSADRDRGDSHGVAADTVSREMAAAGFQPLASERGGGRWYMVVLTKPQR